MNVYFEIEDILFRTRNIIYFPTQPYVGLQIRIHLILLLFQEINTQSNTESTEWTEILQTLKMCNKLGVDVTVQEWGFMWYIIYQNESTDLNY